MENAVQSPLQIAAKELIQEIYARHSHEYGPPTRESFDAARKLKEQFCDDMDATGHYPQINGKPCSWRELILKDRFQ